MAQLTYRVTRTPGGQLGIFRNNSLLGGNSNTIALNFDTSMTKSDFVDLLDGLRRIVAKDMQHLSKDFTRLDVLAAPFLAGEALT